MRIVLNGLVRVVGPGEQALGIVQEVTVVSKRDQHLLNRHLQETEKRWWSHSMQVSTIQPC